MSILDRILAVKRDEVEAAKRVRPMIEAARSAAERGFGRSLTAALRRPSGAPIRVLAEIKRASPSAGPIRPDADPVAIAREYADGGASAISVLTDRQFFDGELGFLARCHEAVPLPILRKDFLIDPYQVFESRAAGADAILLIVAAIDSPDLLRTMIGAARSHNLDALVEVHDVREADIALAAGAKLVGINHRNLATLAIDMSLTAQIAPRMPADVVVVAESGIRNADDVKRLGDAGAHAVLVGEHLMRAPSPGAALRELLA